MQSRLIDLSSWKDDIRRKSDCLGHCIFDSLSVLELLREIYFAAQIENSYFLPKNGDSKTLPSGQNPSKHKIFSTAAIFKFLECLVEQALRQPSKMSWHAWARVLGLSTLEGKAKNWLYSFQIFI